MSTTAALASSARDPDNSGRHARGSRGGAVRDGGNGAGRGSSGLSTGVDMTSSYSAPHGVFKHGSFGSAPTLPSGVRDGPAGSFGSAPERMLALSFGHHFPRLASASPMKGSSNPSPGAAGSAPPRGVDPQGATHRVSPMADPQTSEIPADPLPERAIEREDLETTGSTRGLFRGDFLREHRLQSREGEVLRLVPGWIEQAYWTSIFLAVVGLLFGVFGRLHEYASGPGVIRFSDRADLAALTDGTVISVEVAAGQHVSTGQVLARFYSKAEASELERVEREFELQLVNVLRDPADQAARQSMAALRAQRDEVLSRLEEKAVTATIDGTVSDVRIRPGQYLESGDPVLSIVGSAPRLLLVAFIPGQYRPLLRAGLPLKLRLTGYPYVHQDLMVTSVGDEIVGPGAIRRYLGQDIGDAVPVSGPVVLVYTDLPRRSFRWEGSDRPYYDGMQGRVEVAVRDQSVLVALIPGLRAVIEKLHG